MAKDTLAIQGAGVEPSGEDDTKIINDIPQSVLAANGVLNLGRGMQRMEGKLLYKRTTEPIKNLCLAYVSNGPGRSQVGVWVESRGKLVFFSTFDDFQDVSVVFP